MTQEKMSRSEIAHNWLSNLKYDQFCPLNEAQIKLVNSLKGEFTGDFKIVVTSIGCTKINNTENRDNYYIDENNEAVPYRHYLDLIIEREDSELGKVRAKRTEEIRIEALKKGLILPKSKIK